ncbi:MAG: type II toxin-antitoxin system VapC family toxin [Bryobacteraceae bacterium]|nr:type II toxin-antitoxin system VapC family toxin [Bryobacteraceae bacterium]
MVAVDTNIVVRLLIGDDPAQTQTAELFTNPGAWVSTLVLAETIWVLSSKYGQTAAQLIRVIERLLMHRDLVIEDPVVARRALALYRERPSLGFSDCLILEIARKAGHLPLGTFDRTLGKANGTQKLGR